MVGLLMCFLFKPGDIELGNRSSYDADGHAMKDYPKSLAVQSSQTLLEDGEYVTVEQDGPDSKQFLR
jgi:hypothetical protein